MAYNYQARSTLRADDFVNYVRLTKVPDPSAAAVRVMTIHGAKGLQFDAVVLPELDCQLTGRVPSFVVGRDPKTLEVNFVCRYADEAVQGLLEPSHQAAFEQNRQQRIEESLSLLYVAMTRAVHALYMVIPGPYKGKYAGKSAWCNLLVQSLAPNVTPVEKANIWQHGDAKWFQTAKVETPAPAQAALPVQPISFLEVTTARRRGMDHVAPSSREGQAKVPVSRLFQPSEGTGTAAGTLYHAWFEAIEWLDAGPPSDKTLRDVALKLRSKLPAETWRDLDKLLATFRGWLDNSELIAPLKQSAYAKPQAAGFPAALANIWSAGMRPLKAERERRFLVPDGDSFWNGSLDRVVWIADGDRVVAADVLDYKTDALTPGDDAVALRTEHYRPQLSAYRRVVAKIAGIKEESVAARLLFTCAGRVVDV
jgi:ATP-dependent exoDNAse (exonuclease V) beta subunit